MQPIAILGAGIAGLTAAAELHRRGLPVIVFEAGKAVGGMASSFKDPQGFTYDVGAHFVNNRLAATLGASGICRTVKHYGEAVHLGGRTYGYPLGLMRSPHFLRSAMASRLRSRDVRTAEDWFRQAYGDALAEDVAMPLAEAWSGAPADQLSPAIGNKMMHGAMKSLYLKAAARVTGRAVCIGYSHEAPENAGIFHVYPEGGIAKLLEPTVEKVKHLIRLESPVEKILVEEGQVRGIRVKGETLEASAVISTAPVHVLPKLVEGTDALAPLAGFRYRPMVFANLHFEGRHHLPDTMLWVPRRDLPFFRLTETPISMPWLAPEGKTLITFDIGCQIGDEHWTMPDDKLASLCLDGICELYPHLRGKCLGAGGIVRTPVSYPVYRLEYEAERVAFSRSTGVDGLYSIGRNGEFAHILMEDIYWRTLKRMEDVAAYAGRLASGPIEENGLDALKALSEQMNREPGKASGAAAA
ncbi:NAD(P)/FAD-dependent oxidoreductase [Aurantimonas sp. VKM B-3413]|uniref:protoporphyrinogen/coproporphyrinogen oxidase n=1 Tax=Aurantimonas sp. VKM B-3413 TaxID=2779401 RepID=UPI001E434120|nr:FAD-dependent oxidoreductase [Aurantimonas sp. VKM B-3413]MCB8837833.1 FAD-dependent oxidoreductase [Aurantimonas sp. VKM B-3413]